MALRLEYQTTIPGGEFTEVDLTATGLHSFRLNVSYSHPATLSFMAHAPQHEKPLPQRSFVRFWDDAGTAPDARSWSAELPIFEGFCEEIVPGQNTVEVSYVAYDPTFRTANEVSVMSLAWVNGTTPDSAAVPRLVFNADYLGGDEDAAYQRAAGQTVEQMIITLFNDATYPLRQVQAVPESGAGWTSTYIDGLQHIPQEKIVIESEDFRSAFERLLEFEPAARMNWIAGDRIWRVIDVVNDPTEVTLTLNEYDGSNDVLSFNMEPSYDGRYAAVEIFGPESLVTKYFSTGNGTLSVAGTPARLQQCGATNIWSWNTFQIVNTSDRRIGTALPEQIIVPMGNGAAFPVSTPSLQASWDYGESWITMPISYIDYQNGIVSCAPLYQYIYMDPGRTTLSCIQNFFPPTTYRFIAASLANPLKARYPESGFEGTAYTVGGFQNTLRQYDESLAVGRVNGTPVTTEFRLGQFATLAQSMHKETKDVLYLGGAVLDGIEYDWAWLARKVNIAGSGGGSLSGSDPDTIATGWESAGAWVTDVEYDFEEDLTTLTFSSDQAELAGLDIEAEKKRLKITAMEFRWAVSFWANISYHRAFTMWGTGYLAQTITYGASFFSWYEDPETGFIDNSSLVFPN